MTVQTKARLFLHLLRWQWAMRHQNPHYRFTVPGNPKFMGPMEAVKHHVKDGDCVALSGLAGNQQATILYHALRESYRLMGHPRDLTVLVPGGTGGRGRIPGSPEELGQPGLMRRFFTGHAETYKAMLRLVDEGRLELQILPQGVMSLLFDAQAKGGSLSPQVSGVGTFLDPRCGRGTPWGDPEGEQFVSVEGDLLKYRMPKVDVALFNAPAADRKGNIYVQNAAIIGDSHEIAMAAKRNQGKVIVNVGSLVEEGFGEVFLSCEDVDAVVYWKGTEQALSVPYSKHWPLFTTGSELRPIEAMERLRFINRCIGVTPKRGQVEEALARLACQVLVQHCTEGSVVNVGVGLPEEVCWLLLKTGVWDKLDLFAESGVWGGIPAPGAFFGAAVCPKERVSSAETFKRCRESLDASVLGALQVDGEGNVNVSKRGEGAINYVGPGGFMDFTMDAKTVVFVTSWMAHSKFSIQGKKIRVVKPGPVKFMKRVDEVTFPGKIALERVKNVYYVTHVGVFHLTPRGMVLERVLPGIDVQKDIIDSTPMKVVLPENGEVPQVEENVLTGEGFRLPELAVK